MEYSSLIDHNDTCRVHVERAYDAAVVEARPGPSRENVGKSEPHPAGYPAYLFAANISEGYRLIESGDRKFVFVRNPAVSMDNDAAEPILDIPETVGEDCEKKVRLIHTIDPYDAALSRIRALIPGLRTPMSEETFYKELDIDLFSSELPWYQKSNITLYNHGKHRPLDAGLLQSQINKAVLDTRSRAARHIDSLASEFTASASEVFRQKNFTYKSVVTIWGANILSSAPRWHIDRNQQSRVPMARLLHFWQGPGTVYCETGPIDPFMAEIIDSFSFAGPIYSETKRSISLSFSHPVIWREIKKSVAHFFFANMTSIYDYLKLNPSSDLNQALNDYENYLYYNTTNLEVIVRNHENHPLVHFLKISHLNDLCRVTLNGTVYTTPPGYMAIHAVCQVDDYYGCGALHRSPVPGYEDISSRFFTVIDRVQTE